MQHPSGPRRRLVKLREATALKTHWGHDWAVVNTNWQASNEEEEGNEEASPQLTQDLLSGASAFWMRSPFGTQLEKTPQQWLDNSSQAAQHKPK